MPRDLKSITNELNAVGHDIVARRRAGVSNDESVKKFHELLVESKHARRAEAIWRIYFMHAPGAGLVKIGATSNLNSRLMALQNGSPLPLVLLGCMDGDKAVERGLHKQWSALRAHGEWFQATAELMAYIKTACA